MMSKTDPQRHLATRQLQRESGARGEASGLVAMLDVRRATLPERLHQLGQKVDRRIPSLRRGHRGDQEVFQDRLQLKQKAREKSKGKGKGGKGDKGKGQLVWTW